MAQPFTIPIDASSNQVTPRPQMVPDPSPGQSPSQIMVPAPAPQAASASGATANPGKPFTIPLLTGSNQQTPPPGQIP